MSRSPQQQKQDLRKSNQSLNPFQTGIEYREFRSPSPNKNKQSLKKPIQNELYMQESEIHQIQKSPNTSALKKQLKLDQNLEDNNVFASDEFNDMYNEHVRRKEQIRNKIEALMREKSFLENMNSSDVVYMFQKKNEHIIKEQLSQFDNMIKNQESPSKKYGQNQYSGQKNILVEELDESDRDDKHSIIQTQRLEEGKQQTARNLYQTTRTNWSDETMILMQEESKLDNNQKHRLREQRDEMKRYKERFTQTFLEGFWGKMEPERAKQLRDQVTALRKNNNLKIHKENESFNLQKIQNNFNDQFPIFQKNLQESEKLRIESGNQLVQSNLMYKYLKDNNMDLAEDQYPQKLNIKKLIKKQSFNIEENNSYDQPIIDEEYYNELKHQYAYNQYTSIDRIFNDNYQCFSDIVGQIQKKDWDHAEDLHLHKLNKYRSLKPYQLLCEEDEIDIEAEKVYRDCKNLQAEKLFHYYFSSDVNNLENNQIDEEQIQSQKALEETFKSQSQNQMQFSFNK